MKVLFICNQGENRSKTAAEIFETKFETKFTGLYATKPVSEKEVSWADIIVVMEEEQRIEFVKIFPNLALKKRILCFNMPDTYYYKQPELIRILKIKFKELLEPFIE